MKSMTGPPVRFAEPSICRRYHSAWVSSARSCLVNFSAPSGKWPQKITALVHTLRMPLASRFAVMVDFQPLPDSAG